MHKPQRIGLFGGSFDPIHLGHLSIAQETFQNSQLDKLYFIPTAASPFKQEGAIVEDIHRVAMLRLAIEGLDGLEVDTGDIEAGGVSYTVDTVARFQKLFPDADIFWLIGADLLLTLPRWHQIERLARMVTFVCVQRLGYDFDASGLPSWILCNRVTTQIMNMSSTDIRNRIQNNHSTEGMLAQPVYNYIRNHSLYL